MDDYGYDPNAPWWDVESQSWLREKRIVSPQFWDNSRFGISRPNYPVIGVSWLEAKAFCRWLTQHSDYNSQRWTYRLPTEVEWEWTARGSERRTYPWNKAEPTEEHANYDIRYNGTTAVGCFRAGQTPEGVLDLAGNVWEWTDSLYVPYYHRDDRGMNFPGGISRPIATRGGSWLFQSIDLPATNRGLNPPDNRSLDTGLRLAADLPG